MSDPRTPASDSELMYARIDAAVAAERRRLRQQIADLQKTYETELSNCKAEQIEDCGCEYNSGAFNVLGRVLGMLGPEA